MRARGGRGCGVRIRLGCLQTVEARKELVLLLLLLDLRRRRADGAHLLRKLQAVLIRDLADELVDLRAL